MKGLWSDHWCVVGNFNMLRFPRERNREGRLSSAMRRFFEVIEDLELRDLSLRGGVVAYIISPSRGLIISLCLRIGNVISAGLCSVPLLFF